MKKKLKVLLIAIITVVLMLNFISANIIIASAATDDALAEAEEMETDDVDTGGFLDGLVGVLLYLPKTIMLLLAKVVNGIIRGIGHIGLNAEQKEIANGSIYDILFNKLEITSLNFFDFEVGEPLDLIRENVAMWYTTLRNLAAVVLLIILAYVGVRMALSTIAQEEAKYKKMFKDWLVSFVLLFVLHYLIIFAINLNNGIVQILDTVAVAQEGSVAVKDKDGNIVSSSSSLADAEDRLWTYAWFGIPDNGRPDFSIQLANSLGYTVLMGISIIFLIMYIKRMLTVGFLIMISPIITITYSIDKMGDNRSDALNAWTKEFMANILIQPFHCIIFMTLISTSLRIMQSKGTIAATVFALITMVFIFNAEGIVKKIFNIEAQSLGKAIASAAIVTGGLSAISKGKNGARAAGRVASGGKKMPKLNKGGNSNNTPANNTANTSNNSTSGRLSRSGTTGDREAAARQNSGGNVASTNNATQVSVNASSKVANTLDGVQSTKKKSLPARAASKVWNSRPIRNVRSEARSLTPGKVLTGVAKASIATGVAMTTGMLGISTGDYKAGLTGYVAGKSLGNRIADKVPDIKQKYQVKSREKEFAKQYKKFQNKNGYDKKKMETFSQMYMNKDINKMEVDQDTKDYVNSVKMLKDTYSAVGVNGSDNKKKIMETIDLVENGYIIPPADNKQEQMQVPSESSSVGDSNRERRTYSRSKPRPVRTNTQNNNNQSVSTGQGPRVKQVSASNTPKNTTKGSRKYKNNNGTKGKNKRV